MFSIVMSINHIFRHYITGYMCFFKVLAHQIESWLHRDPSVSTGNTFFTFGTKRETTKAPHTLFLHKPYLF